MPQATVSVIYFPKQSKPTRSKRPKEKCSITAMDWIRNGYAFPGKPLPSPHLPPPKPTPGPISTPPTPDNPPRKPGERGGAQ